MRASVLTLKRGRALRRGQSLPEGILWRALRRKSLTARFRRQHPVGTFILDFYCPAARLAVEVDGASHDGDQALRRDTARDAWLARQGIRVMRFPAAAVLDDDGINWVIDRIAEAVNEPRP